VKGEDLIEDSLRLLESEFGTAFVRIHRNALVGVKYLGRFLGGIPLSTPRSRFAECHAESGRDRQEISQARTLFPFSMSPTATRCRPQ